MLFRNQHEKYSHSRIVQNLHRISNRRIPLNFCSFLVIAIQFILFVSIGIILITHIFSYVDISPKSYNNEKCTIKAARLQSLSKTDDLLKSPSDAKCPPTPVLERYDCYPQEGANQAACEKRGCCWAETNSTNGAPYCFYPAQMGRTCYQYVNITEQNNEIVAFFRAQCPAHYPNDVRLLKMIIRQETAERLHIKIIDPIQKRFESPYPQIPVFERRSFQALYSVHLHPLNVGFKIVRKSDGTVIFDASDFNSFIYSDRFLQLSAKLPSNYIYGLGEHRTTLQLPMNWRKITFFNHDTVPTINRNLYGSHPFYLMLENSTRVSAHGVLLLNSNAMDVILQPTPAITFRPVGGILDFYYFMGPTPAAVVAQYTALVGRPQMPPYWALGFHLCRYGYHSLNRTRLILEQTQNAGIPLDTQWNDLDYMQNNNDFTFDPIQFEGLPEFVNQLHASGMHYVLLIDPGISSGEPKGTYPPYDEGLKADVFVKNHMGEVFVGKVWNRKTTVWPDFTNPNTVQYWTEMLQRFHKKVAFDGAWLDMNEPSNFLSGSFQGCPNSTLDGPLPYQPATDGGHLNFKTLCMSARQHIGAHYDVHNLYGYSEVVATHFALSEVRNGRRPFIITRSTFAGIGQFAGHWSGDVWSQWLDMRYTVPQMLNFALFGVPLMGADICGFNGNATATLCNRWTQLGAFYPFARNHNTDDGRDQDPVSMGPIVEASAKKALLIRYSFLPYLYTLFMRAHREGATVARPLFFEFPNDPETLSVDTQFLWGPAMMILPVLEEGATTVDGYLPANVIWYDFYTKLKIEKLETVGKYVKFDAPLDTIPLLIRGGYILPQQKPELTTTKSRQNPIDLLVAANASNQAIGDLYWDDGDSLNVFEEKRYMLNRFEMAKNVLKVQNLYWSDNIESPKLSSVTVIGVQSQQISTVKVDNATHYFRFDASCKCLYIKDIDKSLNNNILITWN